MFLNNELSFLDSSLKIDDTLQNNQILYIYELLNSEGLDRANAVANKSNNIHEINYSEIIETINITTLNLVHKPLILQNQLKGEESNNNIFTK